MKTNEHIKAEWDLSPELRDEFLNNFDYYLAFRKNEEAGNTKLYAPGLGKSNTAAGTTPAARPQVETSTTKSEPDDEFTRHNKNVWNSSPELRSEFLNDLDSYLAYMRAEQNHYIGENRRKII